MWTKLSDDFHSNRAVRRAGVTAAGLFTLSLSYAARYLTDGAIDQAFVAEVMPDPDQRSAAVAALIDNGLFVLAEEGDFLIPSYLKYNLDGAAVQARNHKKREDGKAAAEKRWGEHR